MAENLVPDNNDNRYTLTNFFDFWNEFCDKNSAQTLQGMYSGLTIKLYKENGFISWKATFNAINGSGLKDHKVNTKKAYCIEYEFDLIDENY
jgi:hypothetical protein